MRRMTLVGGLGALALLTQLIPLSQPGEAKARRAVSVQQQAHQRLLPLEGGQNFRDLGGYRTRDGRTVRWGLLFRSGAMNGLTAKDYAYLSKIGIRTVCDLRSSEERAAAPVRWPDGSLPKVFADDYRMSEDAAFFDQARKMTAAQARSALAASYPPILTQFNSQYRRMFRELLAGNAPLAFNCSAGKDRTGIAAALILTALGVPRETVIQDYLLSNRYFDPAKASSETSGNAVPDAWKKMPPEVTRVFMGVDRSYIAGVFRAIDAHPGGQARYLRDALGLGPAELAVLRRRYTQG